MVTVSCKARKIESAIYYKLVKSHTTAGSYSLSISTSGTYYIIMIGGGGGIAMNQYISSGMLDYRYGYYNVSAGGSGASFEGLITLEAGTYSLTVGSTGTDRKGSAGSAGAGGDTILANYVTVGGGTGGTVPSSSAPTTGGLGGTASIINTNKVSGTTSNGENGQYGQGGQPPSATSITNYPAKFGGMSLYDGSRTGYGAGAGRAEAIAGNNSSYPAQSGAFLMYEVGTSSDYNFKIDTINVSCFYNQGKYYSAQ